MKRDNNAPLVTREDLNIGNPINKERYIFFDNNLFIMSRPDIPNVDVFSFTTKKIRFENVATDYLKIWQEIYRNLKKEGVKALIYGSIALYYRLSDIPEAIKIIGDVRKKGPQDINVLVKEKDREKFKEILMNMGIMPYFHLERVMGHIASMFLYNEYTIKVYYMDIAKFNHDVEIDWNEDFALSITDLLLTKLQVHYSIDKDSADIAALLLKANQIDKEKIGRHIASDWGFWKDAIENLNKTREFASRLARDDPKLADVAKKIAAESLKLYGFLNKYPKTEKWKPVEEGEKYWRDF